MCAYVYVYIYNIGVSDKRLKLDPFALVVPKQTHQIVDRFYKGKFCAV